MRNILIKIILLLFFSCGTSDTKQVDEDWDTTQFFDDMEWSTLDSLGSVINISDSIMAYNWNSYEENSANVHHYIVDAYGVFDRSVRNEILLNEPQKQMLLNIITDSINFEGNNSICFIPHIAFVYYYQSEIIGQSNVCFLCSGIKSVPKSTTSLSLNGNVVLKGFCRTIGLEIVDNELILAH